VRKTAVIQCPDTSPVESLVVMLRAAGYRCLHTSRALLATLKDVGCDVVIPGGVAELVRGMGYDWPFPDDESALAEATPRDMERCDLYVDIKAQKNYAALCRRWPRLEGRVLWYRINGGRPEHVIKPSGEDCGDEVNPPCPVLTPNQWYAERSGLPELGDPYPGWAGRAYACWPPFVRIGEYYPKRGRSIEAGHTPQPPVCLIHAVGNWGYGALVEAARGLGVHCYGDRSPDGLVKHHDIPNLLANSLCLVHLKSNDAPGYALLEALAAACPVVCTRRLIWRCRMGDLLIPGETCLVFDRETHDGLTPADVAECTRELAGHLERLRDRAENLRIGLAGRERLKAVQWDIDRDGPGLREWMARMFP
jgi:hypothetical protein